MVSDLVDQRNLGNLTPGKTAIAGEEGALASITLDIELLANITDSQDDADGTFLTIRRSEVVRVVRIHLQM